MNSIEGVKHLIDAQLLRNRLASLLDAAEAFEITGYANDRRELRRQILMSKDTLHLIRPISENARPNR